jgi:hypothetical protein
MPGARESAVLDRLRTLLLALLTFGMIGTGVDLVLLDHYEDAWQWPPLALVGAGVAIVAWVAVKGGSTSLVALRWTMVLFIAAGAAGVLLHYNGNREFQQELDPALSGWPLFVKVVTAKAPPALAPASMIQLGLLGLLFTFKHPAFALRASAGTSERRQA